MRGARASMSGARATMNGARAFDVCKGLIIWEYSLLLSTLLLMRKGEKSKLPECSGFIFIYMKILGKPIKKQVNINYCKSEGKGTK